MELESFNLLNTYLSNLYWLKTTKLNNWMSNFCESLTTLKFFLERHKTLDSEQLLHKMLAVLTIF